MAGKVAQLKDLEVYQLSTKLGEDVWNVVIHMDDFARSTLGKQWIRSADSVAANISEGFGRYFYKEHRLFLFYARGSLSETETWLQKSFKRGYISQELFNRLSKDIRNLRIKLNNYIHSIRKQTKIYLKEPDDNQMTTG